MFKYVLYRLSQCVVWVLPLKWSYRLAEAISDWHYCWSHKDRRAVTKNMQFILSNTDHLQHHVREVCRNFGRYLVEFFCMKRLTDNAKWTERVQVEHLDRIETALSRGKGAILLTAHIGNWELGGVILGKLGYPVLAVALPHKERVVNLWFNRQRTDNGVEVVPPNAALRRCLNRLRNNQLVALVGDRDFGGSGIPINFFGQRTVFPKGPVAFAAKTGAAIVPVYLMRKGDGLFRLMISEPMFPDTWELNDERAWPSMIQQYAQDIEAKVRAYPNQWMMFREFWGS
jgi:lauroyl/myristoyl acyltransferase